MKLLDREVAIFGATSHIAKGLIYNFNKLGFQKNLFLFVRSQTRLNKFLTLIDCKNKFTQKHFKQFGKKKYDVIINCIGLGTPTKVKNYGSKIFQITEQFDNLILNYLHNNHGTLYINFSSGAVYGTIFKLPPRDSDQSKWNINNISEAEYYGIAKLNSEAKHRALKDLSIVDLRIFGYFSRFIDLNAAYLLSEIISCIKNSSEFITDDKNIIRDYVHPSDLISTINKCIIKKFINNSFDVYSKKPVNKFEVLNFFKKNYGLRYVIRKDIKITSATGSKNNYYSLSKKAKAIGYEPRFSSLDCITMETGKILKNKIMDIDNGK